MSISLKSINKSIQNSFVRNNPMILSRHVIWSEVTNDVDRYIWNSTVSPINRISVKELVQGKVTLQVECLNDYYINH